ncbi:MAG: 3-deoxy-8-phosphooctulonate synthase [Schleiferilactobacillus harbinensis]|jgi:2-dehydro-3-deoxyphosphooctonate aldolase (KDO 8-P synthase)|nr:3-deoxy-8-phosphooctulonate synthase [Schleiferilactobacillus harbinensis]
MATIASVFADYGFQDDRLTLLAGPCAIESYDTCAQVAESLSALAEELHLNYVFKSSFDKANRSSGEADRGAGLERGLTVLQKIKETYHVPVVTDVHESYQCAPVAEVADVLQIPAFLSRQTDLLVAAAKTGRVVNVKKGQFMAPEDMGSVVTKLTSYTEKILLTERGTSFGYHRLVVDMPGLITMRQWHYPVIFDATHSVQLPGGYGDHSGGQRDFAFPLLRAALAVGVDGIFAEVHPDPPSAISDADNQLYLDKAAPIFREASTLFHQYRAAQKERVQNGLL